MKIRTRLSLSFSIIASSIFIVFGIAVYLFASYHRKNEFQERLKERIVIAEKIFLEKEFFSPTEFEQIKEQFSNKLPEETEEVIIINQSPVFEFSYPPQIREEILTKETYFFDDQNTQGYSRVFTIKGKKYIVIITAKDETGLQNLSYLKYRIIMLILIGIPLLLIGSFRITKKALFPITKKINHANAISASNLHERLEVFNPDDEIGELAISFNKLLDRLEASFDAQKDFISNASHEIRNPLTAIMGEAEIAISKTREPKEYIESLNAILNETELLSATVNNLLHLSKITADETSVRFQPILFVEFLKEVKTSFDFVIPDNKIVFKLNLVEKGGPAIFGNKNLLKAAIFNIFDNACKFSSNQDVSVIIGTDKDQLEMTISDSGIGISPSDLENIKAPFYRGGNTLQISGSGIGLSLSDKIIVLHKGELSISSTLDLGTTVIIKLPIHII